MEIMSYIVLYEQVTKILLKSKFEDESILLK